MRYEGINRGRKYTRRIRKRDGQKTDKNAELRRKRGTKGKNKERGKDR